MKHEDVNDEAVWALREGYGDPWDHSPEHEIALDLVDPPFDRHPDDPDITVL